MYRDILLTVDFDRTLTAPDSTIPQRNLDAIRHFIENGGAFTVNTGRSLPMSKKLLVDVPVNAPLLLYNGSAAYDRDGDRLTYLQPIGLDLWETIEKILRLLPEMTVELQGLDAHYRFREEPGWDAFYAHNGCPFGVARKDMELGPFLKFSVCGRFHDVTVASLYEATQEELHQMAQAEELLNHVLGDHCEVLRSGTRILDVNAKGASKATAARALQKNLGRKWLVCVGDGDNDVGMLREADFAYAPADAAIADQFETVCDCAEGAVADVIYKKIPEFLKK